LDNAHDSTRRKLGKTFQHSFGEIHCGCQAPRRRGRAVAFHQSIRAGAQGMNRCRPNVSEDSVMQHSFNRQLTFRQSLPAHAETEAFNRLNFYEIKFKLRQSL
jgi:hypothetical protein